MSAVALVTRPEATTLSPLEPLVTIEDLEVRFDHVVAIENMNFTVGRGEFVSLLGPSGCGKSTLLRAIARLVRPARGRIVLSDPNLRVGFMFQKPLLLPWRTTLDNALLPVELQLGGDVVDPTDRHRARRMLDMVGLGDFVEAYPHQLSGGMQQRAALARALMGDPDVLLLDEPFGALDELTREVLNEELIRIWQSSDTRLHTIVMVTHSIPEAVTMSDRVIVLTGRPARILQAVEVRGARPRAPEDLDQGSIIKRIRSMVRGGR
jgi:NitT/TauT family transport system ATP-binding protein